jgi:crotonobetainyl-CoA:carnitine CoA-transferase CaiB-like acyl-CoA transferase
MLLWLVDDDTWEGKKKVMLSNLKIISLCHYLQGPAAVQYLADMGAEVIKVEPPEGAHERHWSGANTYVNGVSGFYLCANRNARNISIDLKSEAGREVLLKLAERADVVVENFRSGVMDRLGIGLEALRKRNPSVILASASGFGSSGPLASRPGQDLLVQARSGLMSVTGNGARPTAVGCAAVDQHGAALLAMGILGAYVKKLTSGEGSLVEASLFNAAIDLQMEAMVSYFSGGFTNERFQRNKELATWFHPAPYGIYETKDGYVAISTIVPERLAKVFDSKRLAALASTDRYANRDMYAEAVAAEVRNYTRAQVNDMLDAEGLWNAPVLNYDELARDPQALHNGVFEKVDVNGEIATVINHPLRYDGKVPEIRKFAFDLGEDTIEILEELGYGPEEIESMMRAKTVVAALAENRDFHDT